MGQEIRVRFAPSPTGELHLGNARTAIFNWLYARKNNGSFILRIEDTDRERSQAVFREALLDDLKWLGIDWDEGPFLQSERIALYQEYADALTRRDLVYPCYCAPDELNQRRKQALADGGVLKYDNRCRGLDPDQRKAYENEGRKPVLRFKSPFKKIKFTDLVRGDVEFDTSLFGDFVIMKSDGFPTFHFAVVIDDALMKITHIIRGEDHLSNVPKHILLCEALAFDVPRFAHLSMIMGPDGTRLSKRHGATSLTHYRKDGYLPTSIFNYLSLLGWSPGDDKEVLSARELIDLFSLERVTKSAAVFNPEKLRWMGSMHIRLLEAEDLAQMIIDQHLLDPNFSQDKQSARQLVPLINAFKERASTLSELYQETTIHLEPPDWHDQGVVQVMKQPGNGEILQAVARALEKDWTESSFPLQSLSAVQKKMNIKGGQFYPLIRTAITGKSHGPELRVIADCMGKKEFLRRLATAMTFTQ